VQLLGRRFEHAALDVDPGRFELADAAAPDARIRIARGAHDARDAGLDERGRAGPGSTDMAAGLERDVRGRPAGLAARGIERDALRVRPAGVCREPFAD